jgi:hypothetical protein
VVPKITSLYGAVDKASQPDVIGQKETA